MGIRETSPVQGVGEMLAAQLSTLDQVNHVSKIAPRERRPDHQLSKRRDQARHLSIGAPVSASFIGLMLLDQTLNSTLAAEQADEGVPVDPKSSQDQVLLANQLNADDAFGVGVSQQAETDEMVMSEGSVELQNADVLSIAQTEIAQIGDSDETGENIEPAAMVGSSVDMSAQGDGTVTLTSSDDTSTQADTDAFPEEDLGTIGERQEGSSGDDVLVGTEDNDTLLGNGGDDQISGLGGDDLLDGGDGNDVLDGGDGDDRLFGGADDDVILGGAGDDVADGGTGDDRIDGGSGSDTITGGSGNDRVDGGAGSDFLRGGIGDDVLVIDDFTDFASEQNFGLDGGGNDTLEVGDGYRDSFAEALPSVSPEGLASFVLGGIVGRDLPEQSQEHKQLVDPQIENLHLTGNASHDVIGGDGSNEIFGNAGNNQLWGEGGDDRIAGGDADDQLFGGLGDDILAGEDGEDFLFGDGGDDTFLFGLNDSAVDTVFDHQGSNSIKIEGGEGSQLSARMEGSDLLLTHGDKDVARIQDYAGHEDAFAHVETDDGGQRDVSDLLAQSQSGGDILSAFLTPAANNADPSAATATASQSGSEQLAAMDMLQPFMAGADPFTGDAAGDSGFEEPARESVA